MRFYFSIGILFFWHFVSFAQKQPNKKSKPSPEEQWVQDSIRFQRDSEELFRKDSIRWAKEDEKQEKLWRDAYNKRFHPKDSLSYLDVKASRLFKSRPSIAVDSLTELINQNFKTPLHKARAIYFWICTNIKYDSSSLLSNSIKYHHNVEKDAEAAFLLKTGVCAHYTALYQYIATKCGLESVRISGYAKGFPWMGVSSEIDHAWNAVKIKNKWILLDATWGRKDENEIETFWFDTKPEKFIYSHFPVDSNYQLLNKKMKFDEFRVAPIVSELFFFSQIPIEIPKLGYFTNNTGLLQITGAPTKRNYSFLFTVYPVIPNSNNEFLRTEEWVSIPYKVKQSPQKGFAIIETQIPGKGSWWVKVDIVENVIIGKEKVEFNFPRAIIFQITKN